MFFALWRKLRGGPPVPRREKCLREGRRLSYRPLLEALEDRMLPALAVGGVLDVAPVPGVVSGPQPIDLVVPAGTQPIPVTVALNSPPIVIDLGRVFAAMSGIRQGNGLKLSILGNTNTGLVRTDLSKMALTLTFAPGKSGTATITVGATDSDGVSVQRTLLVTVSPLGTLGLISAASNLVGPQLSGTSPP